MGEPGEETKEDFAIKRKGKTKTDDEGWTHQM
jgi:hypothetical protein